MGAEVIHNSVQKAKKQYDDDAYEFMCEFVDDRGWCFSKPGKFTFSELRMLVLVKQRRIEARKIMPGDVYVRQRNKYDGDIFTFKAKQTFHDFCCKHDLYPDD